MAKQTAAQLIAKACGPTKPHHRRVLEMMIEGARRAGLPEGELGVSSSGSEVNPPGEAGR